LADALIGALALKAGCVHTVTFDQKAARLEAFTLL
jgi:predicted nucleic-acid-binding protein